jgi:hypothetical protein
MSTLPVIRRDRSRPLTLSATQLDMFQDCARKWGWRVLDGVQAPQNKYAAAGSAIHAVLEAYLKHGKPPDPRTPEGSAALPAIEHLPAPGQVHSEVKFTWEVGGLLIAGFKDFTYVRADGVPVVGDFKTTSDLRWALQPADLLTNTQSVVYAAHAMDEHETDLVQNRWFYLQRTKAPRLRIVEQEMTRSPVDTRMAELVEVGKLMTGLYSGGAKTLDLDFDAQACGKYGGCPYRANCNLTAAQRMRGLMSQLSLKDRMKARMAEKGTAQTPAPAVQAAPAPAPVLTSPPKLAVVLRPKMRGNGADVNPPESTSPPPAEFATVGQLREAAAEASEPAVEPRKRGRPPKVAPLASAPAQAASEPVQVAPEVSPATMGVVLFVDCAPVKSEGMKLLSLGTLLQPVLDKLAESYGVVHYRLIENAYGSQPAILGAALKEHLKANPLPANTGIATTTQTVEGRDSLETLMTYASFVVRSLG